MMKTQGLANEIEDRAAQCRKEERPDCSAARPDFHQAGEDAQAHHGEGHNEAPAQKGQGAGFACRLLCKDVAQTVQRFASQGAQTAACQVIVSFAVYDGGLLIRRLVSAFRVYERIHPGRTPASFRWFSVL